MRPVAWPEQPGIGNYIQSCLLELLMQRGLVVSSGSQGFPIQRELSRTSIGEKQDKIIIIIIK